MSHYKSNVRDQVFNLFEVLGIDKAFGEGDYERQQMVPDPRYHKGCFENGPWIYLRQHQNGLGARHQVELFPGRLPVPFGQPAWKS